jgi:hypothetical protein
MSADTFTVFYEFEPLRGYAWLYQCNQCWAVLHKRHLDDHRAWHGTILHVNPSRIVPITAIPSSWTETQSHDERCGRVVVRRAAGHHR